MNRGICVSLPRANGLFSSPPLLSAASLCVCGLPAPHRRRADRPCGYRASACPLQPHSPPTCLPLPCPIPRLTYSSLYCVFRAESERERLSRPLLASCVYMERPPLCPKRRHSFPPWKVYLYDSGPSKGCKYKLFTASTINISSFWEQFKANPLF